MSDEALMSARRAERARMRSRRVRTILILAACGLAAGPALAADGVVGPGNCNEAGFVSVLNTVQGSGGGTITFDCGAAPVTIPITGYKEISTAVTIDGGDRITFDGKHASAFFQVFASARLDLRRLILRRGVFAGANVLENFGQLHLDRVTVRESTSSALENFGTATIRNSRFETNSEQVHQGGAAIRVVDGTVSIADTTFTGNVVDDGATGTGGAIVADGGTLEIRRSTFTANRAFDGGAIFAAPLASVRIERSLFNDNRAAYVGAIESLSGDIRISHSRFENNIAQNGDAGAIWALQGSLTVEYSQFTGNSAATAGGALACNENVLTVSRSAFGSNQAGSHGGAIYTTCGFLVDNSTFHANVAGSGGGGSAGGGAIYHAGPLFGGLFYATLADNVAPFGGGIVSASGSGTSVHVTGSLLAGNAGGNCAGVLTSGGYNVSSDNLCGGVFTGTGDLNSTAVPLQPFGDHGGPTFTRPPQPGSVVINRIPSAACLSLEAGALDQRAAARPANGACDGGAYEVGAVIDAIFASAFE